MSLFFSWFFVNFLMQPKWQSSIEKILARLLQAKYENNFLSTSFYNFGYLLWLDHVSKSGDFFLNFGPILSIENLKKHEVF